ncbi:hypothetical protein M378DRAFT_18862 [Amanita muscaria Koide BX008]|uniref:Uncharacterized protein n=1 Tax=Amanita muscaria (strain Koide BX008) TaxID=946122 RepID=A0A0C2W035_AMAMK|nr:hypothetical protein M378DRAFT_18862 [Amanita muscaria Koide BX008]
MPEYQNAVRESTRHKYSRAVDELERLVVQRLLEMAKLGIAGIGYKMRVKIGNALKARAEAICTAIERYNAAAAQLNPPREKLTWANIMAIADLAEFDLLKDTREDVQKKPWIKPAIREAIRHYLKIKRAHEEIQRLNVIISEQ